MGHHHADGAVIGDATIDGLVNNVWECGDGWQGLLLDMTTGGSGGRMPAHVGTFGSDGAFIEAAAIELPAGPELARGHVPCVDGRGVVLSPLVDEESEADIQPLTSLSLLHVGVDDVQEVAVTGWEAQPEITRYAPLAAGVQGQTYFWVAPDGTVFGVPLAGGELRQLLQLGLPDPLPADFLVRVEQDTIQVLLPAEDGLQVQQWSVSQGRELDTVTLPVTPSEGRYISDVQLHHG